MVVFESFFCCSNPWKALSLRTGMDIQQLELEEVHCDIPFIMFLVRITKISAYFRSIS